MAWIRGRLLWAKAHRGEGRLVLVVPRRLGNAVSRNRLKRRLRRIAAAWPADQCRVVVMPQTEAMAAKYADLAADLGSLMARITSGKPQ